MNTKLQYFENTYKFNNSAAIQAAGRDNLGYFLTLDQTILYPQGGGQPSDSGTIEAGDVSIPIHLVKSVGSDVRHYTDNDYSHMVGTKGQCTVDHEKRLMHARLHTSGHLISNVVEMLYPHWRAIKGHHFPEQCYVEFSSNSLSSKEMSIESVQNELASLIEQDFVIIQQQIIGSQLKEFCPDLPYSIPVDQQVRLVSIGDLPFSPWRHPRKKPKGTSRPGDYQA